MSNNPLHAVYVDAYRVDVQTVAAQRDTIVERLAMVLVMVVAWCNRGAMVWGLRRSIGRLALVERRRFAAALAVSGSVRAFRKGGRGGCARRRAGLRTYSFLRGGFWAKGPRCRVEFERVMRCWRGWRGGVEMKKEAGLEVNDLVLVRRWFGRVFGHVVGFRKKGRVVVVRGLRGVFRVSAHRCRRIA